MEEKQEKKEEFKGKMGIVWLTGILVIILGCVTVYTFKLVNENKKLKQAPAQVQNTQVALVQEQSKVQSESEEKNEEISETKTLENANSIIFDGSKAINSNKKSYTLSCQGSAGIMIEADTTQKVLTFSYTPTKVVEYYSLNWTSNKDSVLYSKINFDKKIVDIFFGGMGQSMSGDTVFILLEDGTVEYIPIIHMFNHVQGNVVSYGKINDVNGVIKFVKASASDGSATTLAIKKDGTFYDLWYSLKDKGIY